MHLCIVIGEASWCECVPVPWTHSHHPSKSVTLFSAAGIGNNCNEIMASFLCFAHGCSTRRAGWWGVNVLESCSVFESRPNQQQSGLTFLWFYLVIPVELRDSGVLTLPSYIIRLYIYINLADEAVLLNNRRNGLVKNSIEVCSLFQCLLVREVHLICVCCQLLPSIISRFRDL